MGITENSAAGIISDILSGVYDEQLDLLSTTVHNRRDYLKERDGLKKFYELTIGQKVQFVPSVRPTYLAGERGTLVDKKRTKVVVRLDKPIGRYRGNITTPPTLIEAIVDATTS